LNWKKNSNCVCFSSLLLLRLLAFLRGINISLSLSRREKTRERRVALSLFASAARLRVYPQERSSLAREKVMLVRGQIQTGKKKCFRVSFFGSNKTQNYIRTRAYIGTTIFGRIFEFHAFLSLIIIIIIATD